MKTIDKNFLATSLAAALFVGGSAVVLRGTAFADNAASTPTATVTKAVTNHKHTAAVGNRRFKQLIW